MDSIKQNSAEKRSQGMLDTFFKDRKVFIDTCSILDAHSYEFLENATPFIQQYNNPIVIPFKCIVELQKHSNNKENPEFAQLAKASLLFVSKLQQKNLVRILGDKTDPDHADAVFQTVFSGFRAKYKLLLITQDNNLAKDIIAMNHNLSSKGYPIRVRRINKYGYLSKFDWDVDDKPGVSSNMESNDKYQNNSYKPKPQQKNKFQSSTQIASIEDKRLPVHYLPGENDYVYIKGLSTPVKLLSKIASGGEGTIYNTNIRASYVAKIYNREKLTAHKYEKIKLMISRKIQCEGLCSPVEILYNDKNEFVGYLMPKAKGRELQRSLFIKALFLKYFPHWKKRDTVELCLTILNKIKYLHDQNVIIGDINPSNILVVSPKEVYFVDVDSYQIEGFPCPVGTINYTAPEIQRKNFSSFLRTIGNERFAVATLLFMIMLPGKPPYAQQGGEDPVTNVINMDFSYPLGEISNKKTPIGPWRYIWSHLTYDLKKAFYNTFQKGGLYSTESTRLADEKWISIFSHYLEILDNGTYGQQDKMSEDIYPTRYKRTSNVNYVTCVICHTEVPEFQANQGICKDCLDEGELYSCKRCGKQLIYTNYQKYIKQVKRHDLCPECFKYGNEIACVLFCSDCGNKFTLTNNEKSYYTSRGYDLPKRCEKCRKIKKTAPSVNSRYDYTDYKPQNKKGCFLTTVVCEYLGKADDCFELNLLRNYRDNWLRDQEGGLDLIAEYYANAPGLVDKLKKSVKYAYYCQYLWDNYLSKCIDLILIGNYEECKNLYMSMYNYLEKEMKLED